MLGRYFNIVVEEATLSTATDLLRIVAPSTALVLLHSVEVTFDAAGADNCCIQVHEGTGGGTVTAVTPKPWPTGSSQAYAGTVYDLTGDTDTTESGIPLFRKFSDVRAGVFQEPKKPWIIAPSGIVAVRSDIAVTSVACTVNVVIEEIGN